MLSNKKPQAVASQEGPGEGGMMTVVDDLAESYFQHELMNETGASIPAGGSNDPAIESCWPLG